MPARERTLSQRFSMAAKKKHKKIAYCVGLLLQAEVAWKQNGTDQPTAPSSTSTAAVHDRGHRDIYFQARLLVDSNPSRVSVNVAMHTEVTCYGPDTVDRLNSVPGGRSATLGLSLLRLWSLRDHRVGADCRSHSVPNRPTLTRTV